MIDNRLAIFLEWFSFHPDTRWEKDSSLSLGMTTNQVSVISNRVRDLSLTGHYLFCLFVFIPSPRVGEGRVRAHPREGCRWVLLWRWRNDENSTLIVWNSFYYVFCSLAEAQTEAVAIVGGTLIDGSGRAPLEDAAVVILNGRIQAVGKRGELAIPQDAEVIDAKGMSILPGLIDGHCHYRDWMGEVYLAYGVVTCPNISNNPVEWIIAQREGVKNGSIRGPRVWASANIIDGPPPEGIGTLRRQRTSIIVDSEDEARKAVERFGGEGS